MRSIWPQTQTKAWVYVGTEPQPERTYDAAFFRDIETSSVSSARAAVPAILQLLRCRRVLDVGSGEGAWSEQFAAAGCEVLAVDGDFVDRQRVRVPAGSFLAHDLRDRLPTAVLSWGADLAVCLEVAEHLPPCRGPSFIHDLCACSNRLLFSAATPGQGGHAHINERPHEYWITLIEDRGFAVSRRLQRVFARLPQVSWWYTQNALLAVRATDEHLKR
jgi:hypothetical protein